MNLRPFTALASNNWVDIHLAADYAGVPVEMLVQAITAREVRAITSHPDRLGDWMVPLADMDQWWRGRELVRSLG
jgi:hypothetical protein